MINWFGRTYYGKNKEFKREFRFAFRMWIKHDIINKITGKGYFTHHNCWHTYYRWNKKRIWEEYKEHNPLIDARYGSPGLIILSKKL